MTDQDGSSANGNNHGITQHNPSWEQPMGVIRSIRDQPEIGGFSGILPMFSRSGFGYDQSRIRINTPAVWLVVSPSSQDLLSQLYHPLWLLPLSLVSVPRALLLIVLGMVLSAPSVFSNVGLTPRSSSTSTIML